MRKIFPISAVIIITVVFFACSSSKQKNAEFVRRFGTNCLSECIMNEPVFKKCEETMLEGARIYDSGDPERAKEVWNSICVKSVEKYID